MEANPASLPGAFISLLPPHSPTQRTERETLETRLGWRQLISVFLDLF